MTESKAYPFTELDAERAKTTEALTDWRNACDVGRRLEVRLNAVLADLETERASRSEAEDYRDQIDTVLGFDVSKNTLEEARRVAGELAAMKAEVERLRDVVRNLREADIADVVGHPAMTAAEIAAHGQMVEPHYGERAAALAMNTIFGDGYVPVPAKAAARPGKCPYCPAQYSTALELERHLDLRWPEGSHAPRHLDERLSLAEAERDRAAALLRKMLPAYECPGDCDWVNDACLKRQATAFLRELDAKGGKP